MPSGGREVAAREVVVLLRLALPAVVELVEAEVLRSFVAERRGAFAALPLAAGPGAGVGGGAGGASLSRSSTMPERIAIS